MKSSENSGKINRDEIYLKIWQTEQEITSRRWMTTSLFLTVSFAVFSFTLQREPGSCLESDANVLLVPRIVALIIYWFSILVFNRFTRYIDFIRKYRKKMEFEKETTLFFEKKSKKYMNRGWFGCIKMRHLLSFFGCIYTGGVMLLYCIGR